MAEEVKQALEELTRSAEGNREAQAFLNGIKYGMIYGGQPKGETAEPKGT